MAKIKVLTEDTEAAIRDVVQRVLRTRRNRGNHRYSDLDPRAPDRYLIKLPSGGLPARSGFMSSVDCDIWELDFNNAGPPAQYVFQAAPNADKVEVFNPYPVKWYYAAGLDQFLQVSRIKGGQWVCEKPPYIHKVKPTANVPAGGAGPVSAELYIKGVASGQFVDTYLNWMHGGQLISSGKEAWVIYKEDEAKWVYLASECET